MSYRRYHRYSKKNPVGATKPPFATFNPHTYEAPVQRNENMIITSIDPGIVNCGVYVDCLNTETGKSKSLYLSRLEFNSGLNHYETSVKALDKLEKENKFFSSSHYIVIESQMAISYDNTRMAQHLITYFMTSLKDKGNRPLIVEFNSQSKTRLLGCPKGLKKPQYKKWCREKARSLLEERCEAHEAKFISCLTSSKKGDDMGDAICQSYAWKKVFNGEAIEVPKPHVREKKVEDDVVVVVE